MQFRLIGLKPRSRAGTAALVIGGVALLAIVVVAAFTLFLALAAMGTIVGVGAMIRRRLFGARAEPVAHARHDATFGLDPRLEVRAPDASALRPLPPPSTD